MITQSMKEVWRKRSIIPRVCHVNPLVPSHPSRSLSPLVVLENDGIPGTSREKGKSVTGNLPASSAGDDDDKVESDLLAAWAQRLQVLTILVRRRWCLFDRIYLYNTTFIKTAFLTTIDGELFSLTALNTEIGVSISTTARELVYSCLAGALTFHICASRCFSCCHPHSTFNPCVAILGYAASFALIRYRIVVDDTKVRYILSSGPGAAQLAQYPSRRFIREPVRPLDWLVTLLQPPERLQFLSARRRSFLSPPPLSLLTRCYYTTLGLTSLGFILALTGIVAYMWAGLPMPVGIFSTVCLGISASAGVWAIAV
jgi:hypothetical protein